MDKAPNNQKKPAGIPGQECGNQPLSKEHPGQGEVITNDHYDLQGNPDTSKRIMSASAALGAKCTFPFWPKPLRLSDLM